MKENQAKLILAVCLCICFAFQSNAQQALQVKDSVQLDEIIVTGTSRTISIRHLPMTVSVINNIEIKNR